MRHPRAKKRFGQNFLVNQGAIQSIVDAALVPPVPPMILEIGPGQGALTKRALEMGTPVLALEAERDTAEALRQMNLKNLTLVEGDALKFPLQNLHEDHGLPLPCRIMANLPYNVSTPLLRQFLEQREGWERMVLMFQKEVAERILARVGTKAFSSLSVLAQTYARPTRLMDLSPGSFRPAPKVDSTVVIFTPTDKNPPPYKPFAAFLHQAFNPRRKKLRPRMSAKRQAWLDEHDLSEVRPGAIPVADWSGLYLADPEEA